MLRHGLATTPAHRLEVVELALTYAGGDPRFLFVMLEEHRHMRTDRGTRDNPIAGSGARFGAPTRPVDAAMLIGMGENSGRFLGLLESYIRMPQSHVLRVKPVTWREALHGVTRGTEEQIKEAGLRWANAYLDQPLDRRALGTWPITDHNEAEGVCITAFGALTGLAQYDAGKQGARVLARVKREAAKQGDLFGGSK